MPSNATKIERIKQATPKAGIVLAIATLMLAGCATAPRPLQGEFSAASPADAVAPGTIVRWGGEVVTVEPKPDVTCLQILSRELSTSGRPRQNDRSAGRFVACRQGFYDPAVFEPGREVTVTGEVSGTESRRIGEYEYPLPRVDAEVIYLWPERPDYVAYPAFGPSPFWYPGYYGGYYRPFWPYGFGFHAGYYRHHHRRRR